MSTSKAQNIVIVGGGAAGVNVFNSISEKLTPALSTNLILITPRTYFTHLPATIRTVVTSEGHLEDGVFLPFLDAKFNTGFKKLVIAKVTSISDSDSKGRFVTLDNGETVEYSVLILAPGSIWEGPIDFPDDKKELLESVRSWRDQFEKAQNIVLVGGGAIGAEYAGEIKDQWPNKNVTIIHSQHLLLNDTYPDRYRKNVARRLVKRGVNLVLDNVLDVLEPSNGKVVTRSGKSIPADFVVPSRGGRPNTKFIESLGGDVLTAAGFVKVQPTLQLTGHPRIFALGDVIEWNEQKQAAKIMGQNPVVTGNVLALLGIGKATKLKPYKGSFELILVTNGKNGGSAYLGFLWGLVFGDWFAKMVKSKDLLVPMAKKLMGVPA